MQRQTICFCRHFFISIFQIRKIHKLDNIDFIITYSCNGDLLPINNNDNYHKAMTSSYTNGIIRIFIHRKSKPTFRNLRNLSLSINFIFIHLQTQSIWTDSANQPSKGGKGSEPLKSRRLWTSGRVLKRATKQIYIRQFRLCFEASSDFRQQTSGFLEVAKSRFFQKAFH